MLARKALCASALSIPLVLALASHVALADDDSGSGFSWDHSFKITSDLRFRLQNKTVGDWYASQGVVAGVERNQNTLSLKLSAKLDKFRAVAQIDMVVFGYQTTLPSVGSLSQIDQVQPYRFDVNELYLEANSFLLKGLDLRLGQQIVQWGVGDQFNPTNNLNPNDLRDPLLFGKEAGNFMLKADYFITDDLSFTAVLVPLFHPALLPNTAPLQVEAIDRIPFVSDQFRWRIESQNAAVQSSIIQTPTVVGSTTVDLPPPSFSNMQAALRLAGTIAEQDVALSYYVGRTDFPVPTGEHTTYNKGFVGCEPIDPSRCATGLLETAVTLEYPRMHVYGLNIAGEFNPFKKVKESIKGIGYRFEGALIVPEKTVMNISQDALPLAIPQPGGVYDYNGDGKPGGGQPPTVIASTPFLKWTLGLDYTFGRHVYVNLQWVHGFPDEFGAGDWISKGKQVRESYVDGGDNHAAIACALINNGTTCAHEITRPRIGDFIVIGTDLHFLEDAALLRLFGIIEISGYQENYFDPSKGARVEVNHPFFTGDGFSAALFPEFDYNFGNGFQVGAGALFLLGKDYTKFADPAAGGSVTFIRASYAL